MTSPLKLLENTLSELKHNLEKSTEHYNKGRLSKEEHIIHCENILPKIEEYEKAITILKENKL